MRRRYLLAAALLLAAGLAALVTEHQAAARVNPINVMTSGQRTDRSEFIIVLDNSNSVDGPDGAGCIGIDAENGNYHQCGDGACTGEEKRNTCSEDCVSATGWNLQAFYPGWKQNCSGNNPTNSRLTILKRALRTVLPEFRGAANIALVTYPYHSGYFKYRPTASNGAPDNTTDIAKDQYVTIFLSEAEMRYGGWATPGNPWDPSIIPDGGPRNFSINGVDYKLLDDAADDYAGDDLTVGTGFNSLYRKKSKILDGSGNPVLDADGDETYTIDYKRMDYDGPKSGDWEYVGSFFAFIQPAGWIDTAITDWWDSAHAIATDTYKGPQFVDSLGTYGAAGATYVFHKYYVSNPNSPYTEALDPDFGTVHPVDPSPLAFWCSEPGYICENEPSKVSIFMPLNPSTDQADHDDQLALLVNRFNDPWNGGMSTDHTSQFTPARQAIRRAHLHFLDRVNGTGPYASTGADGLALCRNRFVIFVGDGDYSPANEGQDPRTAVQDLYKDTTFDPPVKTYAIGAYVGGGSSTANKGIMDDSADYGDDGELNGTATSLSAFDEAKLTDVLRDTILEALAGDYTTAAAGVTTISSGTGGITVVDNITLLSSTEFPGWKGHLRAMDMTESPAKNLWDAGTQLKGRSWKNRTIYIGSATLNNGEPIKLVASDGTVNVKAANAGLFSSTSLTVKNFWPTRACTTAADCPIGSSCSGSACSLPSEDDLEAMLRWLAGEDREDDWKLGPVIASTPATVGPPPDYTGVTNTTAAIQHATFEETWKNRTRMSYVLSNEGGLHAFQTSDGNELYFLVIPEALWGIYDLWKQGGQDADPNNFKYVLASSARVEDLPDDTDGFKTHLIVTMGPGGNSFVVLDVNDPDTDPPVKVKYSSSTMKVDAQSSSISWGGISTSTWSAGDLSGFLGETWSVPAVFYDYSSGSIKAHAAMGSGYWDGTSTVAPTDNEFYLYLQDWTTANEFKAMHHPMTGLSTTPLPCTTATAGDVTTCHTGVLANAVGVLSDSVAAGSAREVIATYQADLAGRLIRYPKGVPEISAGPSTTAVDLIAAMSIASYVQSDHPIHMPPAVFLTDSTGTGTEVMLAVATHAFTEDQWDTDSTTTIPYRPAVAKIMMLFEDSGIVGENQVCAVNAVCSCTPNPPATCDEPSEWALPTGQPLLLKNNTTNTMEGFFLFYDPPDLTASTCSNRIGDTWLIRMAYDASVATAADRWSIKETKKISETYGSGLTIIGRGKDLGIALTGMGKGAQAEISTHSGSALGGALGAGEVVSEGIREVR